MSSERERTGSYRIEVAARLVGINPSAVRRCVRAGVVQPAVVERGAPLFGEAELARLRKVRRLTRDLGLNMAGVEVVMRLLDEIEILRAELRRSRTDG